MRTKLFLAFFAVILTALVSNFIFEHLIIRDFEDYALGTREDRLYWVLASVEGSHTGGEWEIDSLRRNMHWAMMLGYDVEVRDTEGGTVLTSREVMAALNPSMRRRMEAIVRLEGQAGEAEDYPLYVMGDEIGSLMVRRLSPAGLSREKEEVFKKRGRDFLLISFLIAGGGAVFLSLVFSISLTGPVRRLRQAAEAVAGGDLGVRVGKGSGDEIGKLNDAFNRMAAALEREKDLRDRLTSNIAHELRTPLAVMKANLEAALDGVVECNSETLAGLSAEVERLTALVEGIEDITRAEAGFFRQVERVEVDVREMVAAVAQGMRQMFRGKGLKVEVSSEGEGIRVFTDPEKLEIILRNIITNSLRHTARGGVRITCGAEGGGFFVEVEDTGRGIPQEELGLIFNRFYRGEGSTGIGIGLSIAKELSEIMGGKIEVRSAPGEGSAFRVALPAR